MVSLLKAALWFLIVCLLALWELRAQPANPAPAEPAYLTVGLYFGKIEEGARVVTFIRLLPPDHPETQGHDLPTATQLHRDEVAALLVLGEKVGFGLYATLMRHPAYPADEWAYAPFAPMPAEAVRQAPVVARPAAEAPVPGLKAVAFRDGFPLCYLIDTRALTLEERGMTRPTSSGLDLTRAQLLEGLARAAEGGPGGTWIVTY